MVTLTVGTHRITLEATDSDGEMASAEVTIEVLADFDGDGLADGYEQSQEVLDWWNPDDAGADPDGDGLTSRGEADWGTDPANPDSDGDGIPDGDEVERGSLPGDPESQPQPPELLASSTELQFVASAGGSDPEPQELLLISSTPEELGWRAEGDVPWLSVEPASGTTTAVAAVGVATAGLSPGNYEGHVTFQGGSSERVVPVQLQVLEVQERDSDADGFTDRIELYLGTGPDNACPDNPSDDAWPPDINMDRALSVTGDVINYVGRIGATAAGDNWWQRLDLDMSGDISVTGDVAMYVGRIGETCR
jgi:hypothetical protein